MAPETCWSCILPVCTALEALTTAIGSPEELAFSRAVCTATHLLVGIHVHPALFPRASSALPLLPIPHYHRFIGIIIAMVELRRSTRSRASRETPSEPETNIVTRSSKRNRASVAPASITIARSQSHSPGELGRSLRLTVKMPAGKMREATGSRPGRRSVNVFQENPIVSGPRSSRNRKKIVEVPSSDDDDIEDQEEDEVEDEDAPGEDDEDADADGDVDMDDAPPQPPARRNAKVAAAPARGKNIKSVEAKEMELEDEEEEEEDEEEEDENVSDTESDAEGEPDDMDESAIPDVNVDDLDEEDEEDELDDELDSDALALDGGKQTKRQRGNLGDDFLQLPMGKHLLLLNLKKTLTGGIEPQVKKHLTAEERIMRRAEMARRRKNLSEKRNEEEKVNHDSCQLHFSHSLGTRPIGNSISDPT